MIEDATGLVLAGGASSRFGSDKASARWGDATLLDAVCRSLSEVLPRILVAAKPGQRAAPAGAVLIADARGLRHPLSGLEAGLAAADTNWVFAVACDMPFAGPELVRRLAALRDGAQAVAVRRDGRAEPFGAFYAKRALAEVRATLDSGGSATRLLERLETRWLEVSADEAGARAFFDIDDPAAYREALSWR